MERSWKMWHFPEVSGFRQKKPSWTRWLLICLEWCWCPKLDLSISKNIPTVCALCDRWLGTLHRRRFGAILQCLVGESLDSRVSKLSSTTGGSHSLLMKAWICDVHWNEKLFVPNTSGGWKNPRELMDFSELSNLNFFAVRRSMEVLLCLSFLCLYRLRPVVDSQYEKRVMFDSLRCQGRRAELLAELQRVASAEFSVSFRVAQERHLQGKLSNEKIPDWGLGYIRDYCQLYMG